MNEDGYAQIWESRDENFDQKFDSLDNQAYMMDAPGYEKGMLLETDAGPAFIGRKGGDVVFAGSRAAANGAYNEFAQELGAYQDGFNGVEQSQQYELEPEIQDMLDYAAEEAVRGEEMMDQILEGEWSFFNAEETVASGQGGETYAATDD